MIRGLTAALAAFVMLMAVPVFAGDIGRVKKASGAAAIERNGQRIPAEPGFVVQDADVLVTGPNGSIAVTFIDNSRFAAGPDSRVTLERFAFDSTSHDGLFESRIERGTLAIVSGQIAKKTPDAMTVKTPTSILGVRGTRFVVEVLP
jgi:hypothetical protein